MELLQIQGVKRHVVKRCCTGEGLINRGVNLVGGLNNINIIRYEKTNTKTKCECKGWKGYIRN